MHVASWKLVVATVLVLTYRGTASAANADPGASADADHCASFKTALVKWPDPTTRLLAGGLAAERVASTAKAIIRSYYARDPEAFDGIVAGAPGFALPRAAVAEAWDTQAFSSLIETSKTKSFEPNRLADAFTPAQFATVREAILDACDTEDGVRDSITAAFGSCAWPKVEGELKHRMCPTTGNASCLTQAQISVLNRVLVGPKNSAGEALYSDWPIDAGSIQSALDFARRFDFDCDAPKIYATSPAFLHSAWTDISARAPDLERFRARGFQCE
jgi:tannase/feruloyl esterase